MTVSLTPLATIVQRVRLRGFWGGEVSFWSFEVGGRVMTNVFMRELDLSPIDNRLDGRRLEVVADGLEAFGGAQLAIDTTLVCALRESVVPEMEAASRKAFALSLLEHRSPVSAGGEPPFVIRNGLFEW